MDIKNNFLAFVQCLLLVSCLATASDKLCLAGYLWNGAKQACVRCLDVCKTPRASLCFKQCLVTSARNNAMHLRRRRRDVNKSCGEDSCPSRMFCDTAVGDCTSCGIICDFSHIQGTTEQCNFLCPGYGTTPTTTSPPPTTTPSYETTRKPNAWHPSVLPILGTILCFMILMGIIGFGYLCYRRREDILRFCRTEERKTPIPCSDESVPGCIDSQTPLTVGNGPIREAQNHPIPATGAPLIGNLGPEMGYPEIQCAYTELDRPATTSTAPKEIVN